MILSIFDMLIYYLYIFFGQVFRFIHFKWGCLFQIFWYSWSTIRSRCFLGHLCFLHDSVNVVSLISTLRVIKEPLPFRSGGFREVTRAWRLGFALMNWISACSCLVVSDSVTPWTVTRQAPLSMWFSRQEYWSGLPFPDPGNIPYTSIKLRTPALQEYSVLSELLGKPMNWISALIKEPRALPCPMWCVGTAKRQPSTNQEECFHQNPIQS